MGMDGKLRYKCTRIGIIRRPKKKCNMLNDKRIKACISRCDNGAYRMQFLAAVSHSTGVHAKALCLTADNSSSSDEDETYETSPAKTSEWSESPATAAAILMFALKENTKNSDQQSPIFACSLLRWTVAMLCSVCCMNQLPIVRTIFYCMAAYKIAAFC